MASLKMLACVAVVCMAVVVAEGITCSDVTQNLMPCIGYLMQGGSPSQGCCQGVRNLMGGAQTTSDRQTVCNCLKADANNYPINYNYAQSLPALCNVNVPYKISPSTNCADIRF